MRASAPEVRLSPTVQAELPWVSRIRLFKSVKPRDLKKRTSAAKAVVGTEFNGTAEPVPFVQQNQPDFGRPKSPQSNQQVTSSKRNLIR
jgi:hypothetical protein